MKALSSHRSPRDCIGVIRNALLTAVLVPALCIGAEPSDENVLWVRWLTPKVGLEREFEEGLKQHHEWRRRHGDTWSWVVWKIVTGERSGTYGLGTFNHTWAEYDNPPINLQTAQANFARQVQPYLSTSIGQYFNNLKEVERLAVSLPRPFSLVYEFDVHYGKGGDFYDAIRDIHNAITKEDWPVYYQWFELYNGGDVPMFARVQPQPSFGDIASQERSLNDILISVYGEEQAGSLMQRYFSAVRTESNRLAKSRNDLSYFPVTTDSVE
jgi:hypothetical protein